MIIGLYIQNHIQNLQVSLAQKLKQKKHKVYCYSNNHLHVKYFQKNFVKKLLIIYSMGISILLIMQ